MHNLIAPVLAVHNHVMTDDYAVDDIEFATQVNGGSYFMINKHNHAPAIQQQLHTLLCLSIMHTSFRHFEEALYSSAHAANLSHQLHLGYLGRGARGRQEQKLHNDGLDHILSTDICLQILLFNLKGLWTSSRKGGRSGSSSFSSIGQLASEVIHNDDYECDAGCKHVIGLAGRDSFSILSNNFDDYDASTHAFNLLNGKVSKSAFSFVVIMLLRNLSLT
jgi:hypothetical protein